MEQLEKNLLFRGAGNEVTNALHTNAGSFLSKEFQKLYEKEIEKSFIQ